MKMYCGFLGGSGGSGGGGGDGGVCMYVSVCFLGTGIEFV